MERRGVRACWWVGLVSLLAVHCSANHGASFEPGPSPGPDGSVSDDGGINPFTDAGGDASSLAISPQNPTLDVAYGQQTPTLQLVATSGGQKVPAEFTVDHGEIASIAAGLLTPSGIVGGAVQVTATWNGARAATTVSVRVHYVENGDPNCGGGDGGIGGMGGVGGEGPGCAVGPGTKGVLQGSPQADAGLAWLYPYDNTVWPRGLLAPLLQWSAPRSYDAVDIRLSEKGFDYEGTFAKTATPFIHHPIPAAAWKALAYSNQGETVTVRLVFAAGGVAYGPITETWKIASGTLKGTVYYQSYGTSLVHNSNIVSEQTPNGNLFGAATLAIKHGKTDPMLVAGSDTECRVCHAVSANGASLATQQGNGFVDETSSAYDLKNLAETTLSPSDGRFGWGALFPDGSMLFSQSGVGVDVLAVTNSSPSALYSMPAGTQMAATGIPSGLGAVTPAFSPDGKHLAFNLFAGPGADRASLWTLSFDAKTSAFSGFSALDTPPAATADVWPAFLPTNNAVIFEREVVQGGDGPVGWTRNNARGELWWLDLATKKAARLDTLNGKGYLPTGPNNHGDDTTLQYEPTVNPVVSGGYAWVVFTSRRMYGNVATIDPYWSYPAQHDLSAMVTTKKLWVAAIDLNAKPGTDPSHPAFYLPGQELLAGNSRGYWVVDPCQADGTTCESGDECCGGYCGASGDGGLVCGSTPPACAAEYDKCVVDSDCCGGENLVCINGRCGTETPQ